MGTFVHTALEPSLDDRSRWTSLVAASTRTFGRVLAVIALGYAIGIAGAVSAWRHRGLATLLDAILGTTNALVVAAAILIGMRANSGVMGELAIVLVLAMGCAHAPFREALASTTKQSGSLVERTALARGRSFAATARTRLRAMLADPLVAVPLEPSVAFSGVFVLEHVLGLDGLASRCVRALDERDGLFFVGFAVAFAVASTVLFGAASGLRTVTMARVGLEPSTRSAE